MQELAQADSRVERMMQLESLFTRDPDLLRDYFIDLRDCLDYENSLRCTDKSTHKRCQLYHDPAGAFQCEG